MYRLSHVAGVIAAVMFLQVGCASSQHYGNSFRLSRGDAVAVSTVLADRDAYHDQYVRVRGTVAEVCERKGCWLTLNDGRGGETVFVKFNCPVDGHLVPVEAVGHTAVVEGTLQVSEISQQDARHYAEDSGADPAEVARIIGPQKQVQMSSPGARIVGR